MGSVHGMSSQCALQMYEVLSKKFNGYQVIERTRFCDKYTDRQADRWTDARGKQYVSRPRKGRHNNEHKC